MRFCSIEGCENKHYGRGWCSKHYGQWRRHGDPNITKRENHGLSYLPIYEVWSQMKRRCYNKNFEHYKYYGGRGIIVCDEWINSAKAFVEWSIKNGYKKGLTIDRINNDGNYEPSNCRFVTHAENLRNTKLLWMTNTSGYRGVSWNEKGNKYQSSIHFNGKKKYLGLFNSPRLAAIRYDVEVYLLNDNRPGNFIIRSKDEINI